MMKNKHWLFLVVPLALVLLLVGAFLAWAYTPLGPAPQALQALVSSPDLTITQNPGWIEFMPTTPPTRGLILYPGGRVDFRSYAPIARLIAEHGLLVALVRMPLNLAVTNVNAADDVLKAYPAIHTWAIGGHSLGGAMAASYIYTHPDAVKALVLWASYPAESQSLADWNGMVVSISASEDGLATPEKIHTSQAFLPSGTVFQEIKGGNHAGFGSYGAQPGDGTASISQEAQHTQIAILTLALYERLTE
jgi:pimeloyl-ACP methyl ester carboxylesterase